MNSNINSIFEAKDVSKEEVRNRFRELNKNGDIVVSVTYNDGDELQVEKGWKIIFRNDWFGLGQNGNFIDMNCFDKFEIVEGILNACQPNVEDYPESIMILFEEHKCVSF